ncbi:MAG: DUF2834 domain-containing protein [Blastocatellia bacterium]|nr:DUF2834 domain-containing protein [Blastocatellia bacterium]MBN8721753.1 DUF2834 domain-containing protein [Acidobacteriota bacterium]
MKKVYFLLAIVGLIISDLLAIRFVFAHGINLTEFWQQMWGTEISTLAMTDLLFSSFIFWLYAKGEAAKYQIKNLWIYIVSTLGVGLCFALPLFLYAREQKKEALGQ